MTQADTVFPLEIPIHNRERKNFGYSYSVRIVLNSQISTNKKRVCVMYIQKID
jgi:hypothetical protein